VSKREVNPNSLANLQPEKYHFNTELAQKAQQKSAIKRKENKLLKEVAAEKLLKKFNGVSFQDFSLDKLLEYCKKEGAEPETVLKILTFLRDTSGQKPKEEVQAVCMPIINIKGL
jgi:hypothetical protein